MTNMLYLCNMKEQQEIVFATGDQLVVNNEPNNSANRALIHRQLDMTRVVLDGLHGTLKIMTAENEFQLANGYIEGVRNTAEALEAIRLKERNDKYIVELEKIQEETELYIMSRKLIGEVVLANRRLMKVGYKHPDLKRKFIMNIVKKRFSTEKNLVDMPCVPLFDINKGRSLRGGSYFIYLCADNELRRDYKPYNKFREKYESTDQLLRLANWHSKLFQSGKKGVAFDALRGDNRFVVYVDEVITALRKVAPDVILTEEESEITKNLDVGAQGI